MVGRRCSECGKTGHNSRTCSRHRVNISGGRVKVFGVHLSSVPSPDNHDGFGLIKKSFSLPEIFPAEENSHKLASGYDSDGLIGRTRWNTKKGVPWTQEEHMLFLLGLQKLGRGHWKGISRNFVPTRTSTQVASHAQKYFLRLNNATTKRCSLSLFGAAGRHEAAFQQEVQKKNAPTRSHGLVPASCRLIFDNNSISQHPPNLELTLAGPHMDAPNTFTMKSLYVA